MVSDTVRIMVVIVFFLFLSNGIQLWIWINIFFCFWHCQILNETAIVLSSKKSNQWLISVFIWMVYIEMFEQRKGLSFKTFEKIFKFFCLFFKNLNASLILPVSFLLFDFRLINRWWSMMMIGYCNWIWYWFFSKKIDLIMPVF